MINKTKHKFANGTVKTQVRVMQSYRPYPGTSPKQRTIRDFGYAEDHEDQELFWREVNACNDELVIDKTQSISFPISMTIDLGVRQSVNYGFKFLDSVYELLHGKDCVWQSEQLKYLAADQILYGGSLKEAVERLPQYYGMFAQPVTAKDLYEELGTYGKNLFEVQKFLDKRIRKLTGKGLPEILCMDEGEEPSPPRREKDATFRMTFFCDDEWKPRFFVPALTDADEFENARRFHDGMDTFRIKRTRAVTRVSGIGELTDLEGSWIGVGKVPVNADGTLQRPDGEETVGEKSSARRLIVPDDLRKSELPNEKEVLYILDGSMSDKAALQVYDAYACCEHTLRTVIPDYDAKMSFINTQDRINGMFLLHLLCAVMIRLIQLGMGRDRIPAGRIRDALREANCIVIDRGGYVMLLDMSGKPGAADDYRLIQKAFHTDFYYAFSKQETFNRFFTDMKLKFDN